MADILIIPTEPSHIRILAKTLRVEDKAEIESYGFSVNRALWRSFKESLICKSVFVDGELAAVFGVGGETLSGVGLTWLITTPACEKVSALRFCKIYQEEVLKMLSMFDVLENYVSAAYTKSVKLLKNIGFTLSEPIEMGEKKALFIKYRMKAA